MAEPALLDDPLNFQTNPTREVATIDGVPYELRREDDFSMFQWGYLQRDLFPRIMRLLLLGLDITEEQDAELTTLLNETMTRCLIGVGSVPDGLQQAEKLRIFHRFMHLLRMGREPTRAAGLEASESEETKSSSDSPGSTQASASPAGTRKSRRARSKDSSK